MTPRAVQNAALKRAALDGFFSFYGSEGSGPRCQICGRRLQREEADACHKRRASQGGSCLPENLLAAHGFRSGARACHAWADRKPGRYKLMESDPASMANGLLVAWSSEQRASLLRFLATGTDRLSDP